MPVRVLAILGILLLLASGCLQASVPSAGVAGVGRLAPHWGSSAAAGVPPPLLHIAHGAAVSGGAEPSILTDRNGRYVWIGDTTGVYYSSDNGTSWQTAATYTGDFSAAFGDGVALAQDESGRVYGAFLHDNRVDVARSADGTSFPTVTYAAGVSGTADRPWLAAHGDDVVLFYFDAPAVVTGFYEHCARSTDAGGTFVDRDPASISPPTGGRAFYDAQGRFYFASNAGVLRRYATTCLNGSTSIGMLNPDGVNNMLQADISGSDLYMAASTDGARTITLAGSHDGGPPKALVVSPPQLLSNTYATVTAWKDQVAVAWYGSETAGDPSGSFNGDFDVYLAIVQDFWGTPQVSQFKVTDTPMHHGTICMGGIGCTGNRDLLDYFMADTDNWGGIHIAYTQDTQGIGVRYAHVPPLATHSTTVAGGPVARFTAFLKDATLDTDAALSTPAENLTFAWDWGDGSSSTGMRASHHYTDLGAFQVTLTVRDAAGRTATQTQGFVIDGSPASSPTTGPTTSSSTTAAAGTTSATTSAAPRNTSASPLVERPATAPSGTSKGTPALSIVLLGFGLAGLAALRRR